MSWTKLGLIFEPAGQRPWMLSHATNPIAMHLGGGLYRVYFASRDERSRSHVAFIEFDIERPRETLRVSESPVLAPGPLGYFDDHGVYAASIAAHDDGRLFLYYMGWNPGLRPPMFYTSIGVAVSEDGGETFRKMFRSPVMSRGEHDPWMVSAPLVMRDRGAWRMWYISGLGWEEVGGEMHSFYHLKYAESDDGIAWRRDGLVAIDLLPGERNVARPSIIVEGGVYKMWYPVNAGAGYRIGYAESADGYAWARKDSEAGIDVSASGWDSKAVAYPWVFPHGGRKYMLYNGNDVGRDGVGLAVSGE